MMSRVQFAVIGFSILLLAASVAVFTHGLSAPLPEIPSPTLPPPRLSTRVKKGWTDKVLTHFHEPSMESLSADVDESYRFIMEPSFHHPIAIRLTKSGDQVALTTKILDSVGTYDKGKVTAEETRKISEQEWANILKRIDDATFWMLPPVDSSEDMILDGAAWNLEGFDRPAYHITSRVWPNKEYTELCRYMLQLAGHEKDYKGYSETY